MNQKVDTHGFWYRLLEVYAVMSYAFPKVVPDKNGFHLAPRLAYEVRYRGMVLIFHNHHRVTQYISIKRLRPGVIVSQNHICQHAEIPVD